MSGDHIPSLPGRKVSNARGMPGGGGEGMLKLRFDWYIISIFNNVAKSPFQSEKILLVKENLKQTLQLTFILET